jgi:DSBA-like thioredoxin domain
MQIIVYGDFNCPYSYLASQRMDAIVRAGLAEMEWRAVEHGPRLALTGTPSSLDSPTWERELAEVADLAQPGEQPPAAAPPMISNTGAAVAAYAEAITDGVQDELRLRLFREIWVRHRHLSSPYEVRRLVRDLMYPPEPQADWLAAPDLPASALHNARMDMLPRLSGCTIAPDGGPLTTQGYRRIQQWRRDWLSGSDGAVPAVALADGVLSGVAALTHLADLGAKAPLGAAGPRTADS